MGYIPRASQAMECNTSVNALTLEAILQFCLNGDPTYKGGIRAAWEND